MKNKMFTGWNTVFLFTLKQGFGRTYKIVTVTLALILMFVGVAINLFFAFRQRANESISDINKVYVCNESGLDTLQFNDSKQLDKEQFPNVVFEVGEYELAGLSTSIQEKEPNSVIARITKTENGYLITVYLPYESAVKKDDAKNLAKCIKSILREGLIVAAGIDDVKVSYIVSGLETDFLTAGENAKSNGQRFMIVIIPIVLMLFLYFVILIYGQSMGNIVSVEKSSKLMETLLVMTRPYGIIFGKIFATACIALIQVFAWVFSVVAGFFLGDFLAQNIICPGYDNLIMSLLKELAEDNSLQAFTPGAIALTALMICISFLFYCILAGAVASFASKAEELGQVMAFYNMFLIIGFFGSYILPNLVGQGWVKVVLRIVPFTGAFLLPGEILVGTLSTAWALVHIFVMGLWCALVCVFAGKVYKDQLFYKGKSLFSRLPFRKKDKDETQENWELLLDEEGRPLEKTQRVGYACLAISPLGIFFALQLLASVVVMNVMTRVILHGVDISGWETKQFVSLYHDIEDVLNPLTMMICHCGIILTFGLWFYFLTRNKDGKASKMPEKMKAFVDKWKNEKGLFFQMIFVCFICGVGLCFFANGTIVMESYLVPSIVENYMELAKNAGLGESIFAILAAVVLAPIGEELLCRGVSLRLGKKAFGNFWMANILQALLFGLLHANWVQGVYAFFIGLILGVIVERYHSLLPSMFVHFVVNFSSSTWVPKLLGGVEATLTLGIILVVVPCLVVLPLLFFTRKQPKGESKVS